jgi:flagellar protein FliS
VRAQDIVSELLYSLDMNIELSQSLMSIYDFLLRSLAEINISKNAAGIAPLLEIVESLRSAWMEVERSLRGSVKMEG